MVAELINGQPTDPELTGKLPGITAGALVIWGRLDGIVPLAHGRVLRTALPNSTIDVIDRCGHLPMAEKPVTFNRLLRDFLLAVDEEIPDVARV